MQSCCMGCSYVTPAAYLTLLETWLSHLSSSCSPLVLHSLVKNRKRALSGICIKKRAHTMSTAAGKCPFAHDKSSAATASKPAAGKCPVDHGQSRQATSNLQEEKLEVAAPRSSEQQNGDSEAAQAQQGKCPVDHSAAAAANVKSAEPAKQQGGRCPFGYDTPSNKPALTDKHCVL